MYSSSAPPIFTSKSSISTTLSVPSQKKMTSCHQEIENHKICGKHIAKNRYVYDARFDSPSNWPVWPANIYCTASPQIQNSLNAPSTTAAAVVAAEDEANLHEFAEFLNLRHDDSLWLDDVAGAAAVPVRGSLIHDDYDEPRHKRLRTSPVSTANQFNSDSEEGELDFDLLSKYCECNDDIDYPPTPLSPAQLSVLFDSTN